MFIRGASGKLLCKGVLLQTQVEEALLVTRSKLFHGSICWAAQNWQEKPIKSIEDLESKRKRAAQVPFLDDMKQKPNSC